MKRAAAALALSAALGAAPGAGSAAEAPRSGWYLAAAAGASHAATATQAGRNRDTICYPNDDCAHLPGGAPAGYRWFYDLRADTGAAFEIAVGRAFGDTRVELSAARRTNSLRQEFAGSAYLDGSAIVRAADSDYRSTSSASADELTTHTLSLNVYRDFPLPETGLVPYVGAGLGLSAVEVSGVFYRSRYVCAEGRSCESPGRYDSEDDTDLSGTVASGHLHAGVGYRLSGRVVLDLKLSFSAADDFEDTARYVFHPVAGLASVTEIGGIRQWSATVGLRYMLGARG